MRLEAGGMGESNRQRRERESEREKKVGRGAWRKRGNSTGML